VHQIIDAEKRILDTELLLKDLLHILTAKDANAIISLGRASQDTLSQVGFFLTWQFGRPAGLTLGSDGFDTAVAIRIIPTLHEVLTAAQPLHDVFGLVALQGQGYRPVPITLLGTNFTPGSGLQLLQVPSVAFLDVHGTPFVFKGVCHTIKEGARRK